MKKTLNLMSSKTKAKTLIAVVKYVFPGIIAMLLIMFVAQFAISFFTVVFAAKSEIDKKASISLSEQVESYRKVVEEKATALEIPDYVNHLLSIMQASSGGVGTDVMNASFFESNTNFPKVDGGITDAEYSIFCGVAEFKNILFYVGVTAPSETEKMLTVYQCYVYGTGYFTYLNGQNHTNEKALNYVKLNLHLSASPSFSDEVARYVSTLLTSIEGWIYPLQEMNITCYYGSRIHPITGKSSFHTGIDLSGARGTPIYAVNDGFVKKVELLHSIWGNQIYIEHSAVFSSMYAHCDSVVVAVGDFVTKGQVIGYVGTTGLSTGNHLHFELHRNTTPINPIEFYNNLEE